jgi:uncharacterized iron-regulated membrane protein
MNLGLRRILFWLHLAAGVTAGVIVAIMAITGAGLAFDPQIRDWAEESSRTVTVPAGAVRLPMDELFRRAEAARPRTPITGVLVRAEPTAAVRFSFGRDALFVDPYRGEVRELSNEVVHDVMSALVGWHRYLGADGEGREIGRAITGVANACFLFLGLSGLVLWWPRRWSARVLRASTWFRRNLSARARDWNWHNVIGFWSLPVLLVITVSGLMISYRPVSNFIITTFGDPGEKPAAPAGAAVPAPPPAPGAERLPKEALFAAARAKYPGWSTMQVRLGGGNRGMERSQSFSISVKGPDAGPRFASIQLAFDPYTGALLKEDRFADQGRGRRVRTWLRFLHTGEALGWPGQLAAGVASLGSVVLVYTGLAMALRRFLGRKRKNEATARDEASGEPFAAAPPRASVG